VAAWRLSRQHLGSDKAPDPASVAHALVGVQAQVLSSAALSVAIRSRSSTVDATIAALERRELVRSWGMRGTLHLFAADDYPTIVAAVRPNERWRRPAWLRWFGVTEPEMESAIETVGEILGDGRTRTRAELRDELATRLGPHFARLLRSSWGSFLNLATNRGYLCHATSIDGAVRFAHPRRWLGRWRDEDPETARRVLTERYLGAYGPASVRDLARWWGVFTQRELAPVIEGLGERVTEVDVDGLRGWLLTEDLEAVAATTPSRDAVQLLGPFDPLIVGGGLRDRLIPAGHLKRVSRTAGWISPVLLVDGVVAGVWDHERTAAGLAVTVEAFGKVPQRQRARIERAAARIGRAHGVAATVDFGPVFRTVPDDEA
jgi:hypothetical protein